MTSTEEKVDNLKTQKEKLVRVPTTLVKKFNIGKCYSNENTVLTKDDQLLWIFDASMFDVSRGPVDLDGLKECILDDRNIEPPETNDGKLEGLPRAQNANRKYTDQLKNFLKENKLEMPSFPSVPQDIVDESGGVLPQYQLQYTMVFSIPISGKDDELQRADDGHATIIALNDDGAEKWFLENVVAVNKSGVESLTGPLPADYSSLSDQEFANHLDLGYEKTEESKQLDKERRDKLKNSRVHGRESGSGSGSGSDDEEENEEIDDDENSSSKRRKIYE